MARKITGTPWEMTDAIDRKERDYFDRRLEFDEMSKVVIEEKEEYPDDLLALIAFNAKKKKAEEAAKKEANKAAKYSSFMTVRWSACVDSKYPEIEEYYLQQVNRRLNRHFFDISAAKEDGHDKLNWLTATTVSPGGEAFRRKWISLKRDESKIRKFLASVNPTMKDADLDVLTELTDFESAKSLAIDLGWTNEQIKSVLGNGK